MWGIHVVIIVLNGTSYERFQNGMSYVYEGGQPFTWTAFSVIWASLEMSGLKFGYKLVDHETSSSFATTTHRPRDRIFPDSEARITEMAVHVNSRPPS